MLLRARTRYPCILGWVYGMFKIALKRHRIEQAIAYGICGAYLSVRNGCVGCYRRAFFCYWVQCAPDTVAVMLVTRLAQQSLYMRRTALAQCREVITALETRNDATLCMPFGDFHETLRNPGVVLGF